MVFRRWSVVLLGSLQSFKVILIRPIFIRLAVILLAPVLVHGIEVTAEGRASGDYRTAREQALADALREGVRKGIGVDLLGETKVKDFNLDYDRVLCSAFGHVKNYSILEAKLGKDGIYRVKIQADVEKGIPGRKNKMALAQLIQAKGAPRLAFSISNNSEDEPNSEFSASVLQEIAADLQIPVAKPADEEKGNSIADYMVEGRVESKLERTETIGVNPTTRVFTILCDLKAIDPATREVVAIGVFGADRVHKSTLPSEEAAMRDAIKNLLTAPAPSGGMRFFEKLLSRWVAETDLGTVKRLRFTGITAEDYEKIYTTLADTDKVGAVWPREFNSNGISVIDVETRLDNSSLAKEVSKSATHAIAVARSAQNQIAFKPKKIAVPE